MIPWRQITQFGDVTITSVLALAIAAWLLAEGEKRLALWWCLLFAFGTALVLATKIAFIGWGIGIRSIGFTGFSGHAVRVAAIVPVLLYLMLQKASPGVRALGVLGGYAIALLLGISRLAVHAHSVSEVVTGLILGGTISLAFIMLAGSLQPRQVFGPLRVALIVLALLPAPYVQPAPTQRWLTRVTLYVSGHDRPCVRSRWTTPCPLESDSHAES